MCILPTRAKLRQSGAGHRGQLGLTLGKQKPAWAIRRLLLR